MQNLNVRVEMREEPVGTITCPSCDAQLTAGLRFCRMCGYRLGEGVEEFVPTQLLDPTAAPAQTTDPFAARQTWGGVQPVQPLQSLGTTSLNRPNTSSLGSWASACKPRSSNWWIWIIVVIAVLAVSGAVSNSVRNRAARRAAVAQLPATSILDEVDDFDTADGGGAFIEGLAGPDTSLERAGLMGGDIITSLDGKPVRDEDAIRRILATIPPGKTVPIGFIHDNESKTGMLTTIAKGDFRGMGPIDARPGGRGLIGIDSSDPERVRVPNTNIYGVELGDINRNGPADLAGLKKGDIITEFNGKPIRTPGDLRLRIYEAVPGDIVKVVLMRGGEQMTIDVKMGRSKN
jgi:membrane-associated protease RseP (regulator of RpoE activity)